MRRAIQVAPLVRAARRACARHLPGRDVVVDVEVVGEHRMRALNRAWRGVDRATDVLSLETVLPPVGPVLLGPVVLCPARAERAAAPELRSLSYLLAHGLLHCLGWDHPTDAAATRMDAEVRRMLREP